ncbi:MAG: 4Fe-4S dicluster domain-containing protein [Candidatus Ozemobacteraceae bacterium]
MADVAISELGLVGCGGAGFPTHVKLAATNVEHLIINGAECEPLLHKDKELLEHFTKEIFAGILKAMSLTGAKQAHLAVKKKYAVLVAHLDKSIPDRRIKMLALGDFYPTGDEYELVYEASGRLIPFGGIPLHVGCVVINAETLLNLGRGTPVITKFLTINGAVPKPLTVEVPIGITIRDALALAGLTMADGPTKTGGLTIIDGGPMMGRIVGSLDEVVTKTCGGLLALPNDHPLIRKMTRPAKANRFIARSNCDQCTDCTELCPRRLLGYPIAPHKAMRTAQLAQFEGNNFSIDAIFCSECGLCSLFACPEDLPPREICKMAKTHHLAAGIKQNSWQGGPVVHPMRSARRVSIERLVKRLGLLDYDKDAPLTKVECRPARVKLPLRMHIGGLSVPVVKSGDRVVAGQKIASIPEKQLGAVLHASISGRVEAVGPDAIIIAGE